ncbi:Acyl-coenzyme A thioesterase 13 [Aphelenchoides bicaudatus]|nr:Acyl-coenzyme A thioesterase 13 [Aphelenchoides bicaudatus]
MAENGEQVDWLVRLKENIDGMLHSKNYARYAQILTPISATEKTAVMEFKIPEELLNGKGTLHGGQTALLVDITTALCITLTVRDTPLVSVEIACSYLAPAVLDELVTAEVEILKLGRNIVFSEVTFRKKDRSIIAKGKHTLSKLNHLKTNGEFVKQ